MILQGIQRSRNFPLNIYHVLSAKLQDCRKTHLAVCAMTYDLFSPDLHGHPEPEHL